MNKSTRLLHFFLQAIEGEIYAHGERLPSLREVCRVHQVSMSTAKKVYYDLERQGYVQACPREGFRVLTGARPTINNTELADWRWQLQQPAPAAWGSPFIHPSLAYAPSLAQAYQRALRHPPSDHPPMAGFDPLRRQIARRYLEQGVAVDWRQLLITCGAMEGLQLALRVVSQAKPQAKIVVMTPAFPSVFDLLQQAQIPYCCLAVEQENDLVPQLAALASTNALAGVVLMSQCRHPDGKALSDRCKTALVEFATQQQLPLIEDDTYRELIYDGQPRLPLLALDRQGIVLHTASFSKTFASGHRVGWLATGRFHHAICALKHSSTLGSPLPSQHALATFLAEDQAEPHLSRLRPLLQQRIQLMRDTALAVFPTGTHIETPAGGYFLWVKLPSEFDPMAVLPLALRQGIHFAPGSLCQPHQAPHYLRLNASAYLPAQAAYLTQLGSLLQHSLNR